MRTARMLDTECRQVLQGSVGTGLSPTHVAPQMSQVLGVFGLLDFTMTLKNRLFP
jgi:hypothetical protein